jgi:hypothetical protein
MGAFKAKPNKIWDRWSNSQEGPVAYQLLLEYLEMGRDRSFKAVAERTNRPAKLIGKLATKFQWTRRADDYDEHLIKIQKKAMEQTAIKEAVLYAERRSIYRNKEYTLAEKLLQKAMEMLSFPLVETVENELVMEDGQLVSRSVTVKPVRWSLRDASALADTASKIMRLSLEMETSRETITVNLAEDPEARLAKAKAALGKMRQDIDRLVVELMASAPDQDPEEVRLQVLERLPTWVSEDWAVPREKLIEDDDDLPSLGMLDTEPTNDYVS